MVAALHTLHRKKLPGGWLLLLAMAIFPLLACAQSGKLLERQVKVVEEARVVHDSRMVHVGKSHGGGEDERRHARQRTIR